MAASVSMSASEIAASKRSFTAWARMLCIAGSLFLAACNGIPMRTTRMYSGDPRPANHVARLGGAYASTAKITSIDGIGTPTEMDGYLAASFMFELLPGPHTATCSFERGEDIIVMTLVERSPVDKSVSWNAQAGATYLVWGAGRLANWVPEVYRVDKGGITRVTKSPHPPLTLSSKEMLLLTGTNLWGTSVMGREIKRVVSR